MGTTPSRPGSARRRTGSRTTATTTTGWESISRQPGRSVSAGAGGWSKSSPISPAPRRVAARDPRPRPSYARGFRPGDYIRSLFEPRDRVLLVGIPHRGDGGYFVPTAYSAKVVAAGHMQARLQHLRARPQDLCPGVSPVWPGPWVGPRPRSATSCVCTPRSTSMAGRRSQAFCPIRRRRDRPHRRTACARRREGSNRCGPRTASAGPRSCSPGISPQ